MPDFEAMTDLEIRRYKSKIAALRDGPGVTREQDTEMRAEMIRAQAVINERQRARISEAYASIPAGAVSTMIAGAPATGGAAARASGG